MVDDNINVYKIEIDRYIGLPIFFPIFKHFTITGYRFWKKKKRISQIHNYTEYNQQWNVFSVFDPSKCTHTLGSVGTVHSTVDTQEKLQHGHRMKLKDSLVWNTLNYINIYYRTIISPINISIEINYLLSLCNLLYLCKCIDKPRCQLFS